MSKLMCPTCHKHWAIINKTYGPTACKWCLKKSANEVRENGSSFHVGVNVPAKGSPEWYKGKWFRRTQREWEEDIKSRVTSPDGRVVRRIGQHN